MRSIHAVVAAGFREVDVAEIHADDLRFLREALAEEASVLPRAADDGRSLHAPTISRRGNGKIILPPRSRKLACARSSVLRKCHGSAMK